VGGFPLFGGALLLRELEWRVGQLRRGVRAVGAPRTVETY